MNSDNSIMILSNRIVTIKYLFKFIGDRKASSDIKALLKSKNLKESDRVLACSFLQQGGFFFFRGIVAAVMKKSKYRA